MNKRIRLFLRLLAVLGCIAVVAGVLVYAVWTDLFSGLDYRPTGEPTATAGATASPAASATASTQPSTPVSPTDDPPQLNQILNVLLIGTDSRHEGETGANSDVLMVVTVDRLHGTLKLLSILRDLWVPIPGHGTGKINAAYALGGAELSMKTVNLNFGLDIEKYVEVDFKNAEDLIDIGGGVEIDVTQPEIYWLNKNLDEENDVIFPKTPKVPYVTTAGLQHLVGRQAVCYARIRKLDSDFKRTERQRTVLKALRESFLKAPLVDKERMVKEGLSSCTTNLSPVEITWLAIEAFPLLGNEVQEMLLPTAGDYKVYRGSNWCMVPDRNAMLPKIQRFIWEQTSPFEPFAPIVTPYEAPTAQPTSTPGPTSELTPTLAPTGEPTASSTESPTPTETPTV